MPPFRIPPIPWNPTQGFNDRGSVDRPALASAFFNERGEDGTLSVHAAWRGVDGDQGLYYSRYIDGWIGQKRLPAGGSSTSPALIAHAQQTPSGLKKYILMTWKGINEDSAIYWAATSNFENWGDQQPIPGIGTSASPSLASLGGTVYMAWKGIPGDSAIYWAAFNGMNGWHPQKRIPGVGTSDAPSLVAFKGRLYLFWKGIEDDTRLFYSHLDPGGDWAPQTEIRFSEYSPGSTRGPDASVRGADVLLIWRGIPGDNSIYYSIFNGDVFSEQNRFPHDGSSAGPAATNLFNGSILLWKGVEGDTGLYWTKN